MDARTEFTQTGSYYPCYLIKNLKFLLIQPDKKETEIKGKERSLFKLMFIHCNTTMYFLGLPDGSVVHGLAYSSSRGVQFLAFISGSSELPVTTTAEH